MKTISTFTIVKNEVDYIGYNIMSVLPYVTEMVFADGNSTDGTVELIRYIKNKYDTDNKIKLFENMDCADLKDDYVRLFNETLKKCTSDYVWFLHPDMICINPETIVLDGKHVRYSVNMISFAGDRKHIFTDGRDDRWATIYANGYGLHFHGYYGAREEDFYFSVYTGKEHKFYKDVKYLPYSIKGLDITLCHYCDTKPYERRYDRMVKTLKNIRPGMDARYYKDIAENHPRVTLDCVTKIDDIGRKFKIEELHTEQPEVFERYGKEFERFRKTSKKG